MKVIKNKLVVEPVEKTTKTTGGIFLPDQSQEGKAEGTVICVGPDCDPRLQVGVTVVYAKYSGDEVKVETGDAVQVCTKTYRVIRDLDVLLIK